MVGEVFVLDYGTVHFISFEMQHLGSHQSVFISDWHFKSVKYKISSLLIVLYIKQIYLLSLLKIKPIKFEYCTGRMAIFFMICVFG